MLLLASIYVYCVCCKICRSFYIFSFTLFCWLQLLENIVECAVRFYIYHVKAILFLFLSFHRHPFVFFVRRQRKVYKYHIIFSLCNFKWKTIRLPYILQTNWTQMMFGVWLSSCFSCRIQSNRRRWEQHWEKITKTADRIQFVLESSTISPTANDGTKIVRDFSFILLFSTSIRCLSKH